MCSAFERRFPEEFEELYEDCNRRAPVQVMTFVATNVKEPGDQETLSLKKPNEDFLVEYANPGDDVLIEYNDPA